MTKNMFVCDCNMIHQDIVMDTKKKMTKVVPLSHLSQFFQILGDNTRCQILYALLQNELCVCDIANVINRSKSLISHQLRTLREHGLVAPRKVGKEVYYRLDDDHVKKLLEMGLEHLKHKEKEEEE